MPLGLGDDPHCGPFNPIWKETKSRLDEICREHDLGYSEMGTSAYYVFNKYDEQFLRKIKTVPGMRSWLYRKVFEWKRSLLGKKMSRGLLVSGSKGIQMPPSPPMGGKRKSSSVSFMSAKKLKMAGSKKKVAKKVGKGKKPMKLKTYRVSKKTRRVAKRVVKAKVSHEEKCLKEGSVFTYEQSGKESSDHSVYLGHTTAVGDQILKQCIYAIVRKLFKRQENFYNWDYSIEAPTATATLYLKHESKTSGALTNYASYALTPAITYRDVVSSLIASIQTWLGANNDDYTLASLEIYEVGKGTISCLSLRSLKIHYKLESTMKCQNVSYTADALGDDDNALNVDRIPVIGKGYGSRGPGFQCMTHIGNNRTRPFFANDLNGLIITDGEEGYVNATYRPFREPPSFKVFQGAWSLGGMKLPSGVVKRDVLVLTLNVGFNKLLWMVNNISKTYFYRQGFGKSHMFGFEKEINLTSDKIVVGYEVNQKHMVYTSGGFSGQQALAGFDFQNAGTT